MGKQSKKSAFKELVPKLAKSLVIGLVVFVIVILLDKIPTVRSFFNKLESALSNTIKFQLNPRPELAEKSNIVIVGIDEESQSVLGPFPWPRNAYANIIRYFDISGKDLNKLEQLLKDEIRFYETYNPQTYSKLPQFVIDRFVKKYEIQYRVVSIAISQLEDIIRNPSKENQRKLATLIAFSNITQLAGFKGPIRNLKDVKAIKVKLEAKLFQIKERLQLLKNNSNIGVGWYAEERTKILSSARKLLSAIENAKANLASMRSITPSINPLILFFDVFFDMPRKNYVMVHTLYDAQKLYDEAENIAKSEGVSIVEALHTLLERKSREGDYTFFKTLAEYYKKGNFFVTIDFWGTEDEGEYYKTVSLDEVVARYFIVKNWEVPAANISIAKGSTDKTPRVYSKFPLEDVAKSVVGIGSATVQRLSGVTVDRIPLIYRFRDDRIHSKYHYIMSATLANILRIVYNVTSHEQAAKIIKSKVKVIIGDKIILKDARIPIFAKHSVLVINCKGHKTIVSDPLKIKKIMKNVASYYAKGCRIENPTYTVIKGYKKKTIEIPIDESGQFAIRYRSGPGSFGFKSFHSLLPYLPGKPIHEVSAQEISRRLSREYWADLKNKIILVGIYTTTNIQQYGKDTHPTPYGMMFGIELIANAISNILNGDFIKKPKGIYTPWGWIDTETILTFLGIIAVSLLVILTSVQAGVFLVLGLVVVYGVVVWYLFGGYNLDLPIALPVISATFNFIAISTLRLLTEEKEKRFIKAAFEHYLSPAVISELMKDPKMLNLGGEQRVMTAFFSDVQKFSSISEKLTPTELVALLNEYLSAMTDIIISRKGTIDKYEGDAIIAFWGAPVYMEDHAIQACYAAIEMQQKLAELRELWKKEGRPPFIYNMRMRIGINTGEMVVGNMGSKFRMDYTMMGDNVNLASRLEGANKFYGTYTMISEFTYEHVKDHVEARELDKIRVVGKEKPVTVYELLAKKGELDPTFKKGIEIFTEALELYRNRKFEDALKLFNRVFEFIKDDTPTKVYIERCQTFIASPPPEDWDGVYTLTSK